MVVLSIILTWFILGIIVVTLEYETMAFLLGQERCMRNKGIFMMAIFPQSYLIMYWLYRLTNGMPRLWKYLNKIVFTKKIKS